MKIESLCHVFTIIAVSNLITVSAITKTREADVLNLNEIQDGGGVTERGREREKSIAGKEKEPTVTETQENRSFFKPDADRRGGSFYPSGTPLGPGSSFGQGPGSSFGHGPGSSFGHGPGSNFGHGLGSSFGHGPGSNFGQGPNYHSSGNGFSYGAPSGPPGEYPPPPYGGNYPSRPISPPISPPSGHSGPSDHSGYGGGLGGGHPLVPSGGGGHNHAMALKGLLLPIAGVALLGAAAVLAKSNPMLLQLGVVSGKRRRRELGVNNREGYPQNPFVRPERD